MRLRLDGQVASLIRPFIVTIPRMLVRGAMMRSALRGGAQIGRDAQIGEELTTVHT